MKTFNDRSSPKHLLSQGFTSPDSMRQLKLDIQQKTGFNIEDPSFSSRSNRPFNDSKQSKNNGIGNESIINLHSSPRRGKRGSPNEKSKEKKKKSLNKQISKKKTDRDEIIKPKKDLLPNGSVDIDELREQYIEERRKKGNRFQEEVISIKEDGIK